MGVKIENLREMNKAYKRFIELSKDDIRKTIEIVGYNFFGYLQSGTPKESGRARNGWIPVVGGSPSEWKPSVNQSVYGLNHFPMGQVKFDSVVWISNNVEYIRSLDDGHSQQAPYGFTNAALQAVTFLVQRKIERINKARYRGV